MRTLTTLPRSGSTDQYNQGSSYNSDARSDPVTPWSTFDVVGEANSPNSAYSGMVRCGTHYGLVRKICNSGRNWEECRDSENAQGGHHGEAFTYHGADARRAGGGPAWTPNKQDAAPGGELS